MTGPELRLADLNRRELENLILTEHGLLRRVLETIRAGTKPEWKVRKDVERIVEEAQDRRPFRVAITKAQDSREERFRVYRNEARWSRWDR